MADKKYKYEVEEITTVNLDFDKLEEWRDTKLDDIPICSCFALYEASGLEPAIRKYSTEHDNMKFVAADNLCCNFYTLQRIKNFITDNWSCYSLDIQEDNHIIWDTKKWKKNEKHYPRTLKAMVRNSVNMDFLNFCPGIDDEMEDNILAFRVYHKVEVEDDGEEEQKSI